MERADASAQDRPGPDGWPEAIEARHEYRVLIFAPTGSDARLTAEFLGRAGIATFVVKNREELCASTLAGCGAIVLAEEALTQDAVTDFFELLKNQPAWSDLPVTLITTGGVAGGDRLRQLTASGLLHNITVLERPFRPSTLISTLEVALRSRRRQYEVRRLLIELGQARDTAERANNAKDEFLAALSHELRTPLNPALLIATEAARDLSLPSAVRQDFEDIARNVMLEARLIDDLLDITRISRGKMPLEVVTMNANDGLRAALATTEADFAEKRLRVEVSLGATESGISADPVRLQQVLWNVLKNAAKFTPVGGSIRVTTRNEPGYFVVAVADTGVGMDRAELNRVFEAFTQGNHARAESGHRFGGLGLGLAISRRLMELHGGSIEAASAGIGRGSEFLLRFPLSSAARAEVRASRTERRANDAPLQSGRRILLLEDHEATRVSLKRLLEHRGFRVQPAASLAEARRLLDDTSFDLILSDLGLPDGSGHELMAHLHGRDIPCIALSGYGMEADVAQSMRIGFRAHLTKPVTIEALDQALANATSLQGSDLAPR